MTLEEEINKYRLTNEQRQAWYDNLLRPTFLGGLKPNDKQPVFTLLTAQPGAGKTTAAVRNAQETSPYPARFGGDDIRILHPYARIIMLEDVANYPFITKPDMAWAREKLVDDCLNNRYNLQIDSILSNIDDYKMGTIMRAKEQGYRIECVTLGVPDYLSIVSMYNRRETQIERDGVGFPVTIKDHDRAYGLLPEVIAKMYDAKVADRVSVINRQFKSFYDTNKVTEPNGAAIKEAVIQARNSYMQKTYLAYVNTLWKSINQQMVQRKANDEQMIDVKEQYQKFTQSCIQNGNYNPQYDKDYLSFLPRLQQYKKSK